VAKKLMKILTSFAMRPGMALLNLFQSGRRVFGNVTERGKVVKISDTYMTFM